jgi:3',5'-cyclic AMP phosphodiesterase CpdA
MHGDMTFRIAQISDTHLSRRKPLFVENFDIVAGAPAASAPDLVLNTGDMSLDGVADESDLAEARRLHGAIGLPTRFIISDTRQPRYGEKEVGYVEHRFEPDGSHTSILVRVPGLKRLDIADLAEAAYGVR